MSQYDILVMGAGHNQLGAAAYLAKAGKKVLVLEMKEFIGGGAVTLERTVPGFFHNKHSAMHGMIQANPLLVNDELKLKSKYGLEYFYPEAPMGLLLKDFRHFLTYVDVDRTCQEIARYSEKDADTYRKFVEWGARMMPLLLQGMFNVPIGMGPLMSILEASEDGRRLLDLMFRSPLQIVDELFETEILKIHLLKWVSEGILQFPDDMGTGFGLIIMILLVHFYPVGFPTKGSGALSRALADCLTDHGGEIRCNTRVDSVIVEGGRAAGLRTADGEQFRARDAVIAGIHPARLDTFVSGLDADMLARAKRVRNAPYSLFKIDAALNRSVEELSTRIPAELRHSAANCINATSLQGFLDSFEPLRRGQPGLENPLHGGGIVGFPGLQPEGKSQLYLTSYQPYSLNRQGPERWDEIKEDVADRLIESLSHFFPGLAESVIAREVDSPLDMERWSPNSFVNGEVHGAGLQLFQTMGLRPTPELARYAVPGVDRLYLCGPFMHPGGAIFGAGRPTAIKVMDDLGIDFDKVVSA
ncbi:MAG: NAD(P)/FAD-dependent oxidoreductase [Alteraurantiacibacter sp.]|nr:NAD(P)/FAD-dependent oxidoreductase [Alteraurantiacibacter sp.]